jgi:hypothetical protein
MNTICVCVCLYIYIYIRTEAFVHLDVGILILKNIHDMCMYVMMRKWTCIKSNICVVNEYGFSITFSLKGSWPKTSLCSGGITRIRSSAGGGHKASEAGASFSLLFALMQFNVLLVNAKTINSMFNVNKV